MVVVLALSGDLVSEFVEVGHYEGVYHLDVLVVLCGEVVFHESDFLTQHVDLFFVLPHVLLRLLDEKLNSLAIQALTSSF